MLSIFQKFIRIPETLFLPFKVFILSFIYSDEIKEINPWNWASIFKQKAFPTYRLPRWHIVKKPLTNAGDARDTGLIPGSGRSPGVGNGNPLYYYHLGKIMDKGAWWATVHGVGNNFVLQMSKQA